MAREAFQTLTEPMYYILLALTGECCGVDIMERVREMTGGRVRLGPGTLYTLLAKFQDEGLIAETEVDGRKRTYQITEKGREAFREELDRLRACVNNGEEALG